MANHAENQKAYEDRRREHGWRRRCVWVPPLCQDHFDKLMARLYSSRDFIEAAAIVKVRK